MINTIYTGLEEFEEKIDKIAEGEDDGENSWISKIYNQFSFFNDGQNSLEENDMDGLEPPILDETWGLGLRNAAKGEEDILLHFSISLFPPKTVSGLKGPKTFPISKVQDSSTFFY